jgi:hypothetical protein
VMVLAPEARITRITSFKGFYAFAFTR